MVNYEIETITAAKQNQQNVRTELKKIYNKVRI